MHYNSADDFAAEKAFKVFIIAFFFSLIPLPIWIAIKIAEKYKDKILYLLHLVWLQKDTGKALKKHSYRNSRPGNQSSFPLLESMPK